MEAAVELDIGALIGQYGFPIIAAIGLGYFIYYIWQWSLSDLEKSTMTWRWAALSLYLLICFYDFMFVPIWYGLTRPDVTSLLLLVENTEEVLVQLELMSMITSQHMPFTLMGGGLFHLAFGAILTGSAVGMNK